MNKEQNMPEISEEEFAAKEDKAEFCRQCGEIVRIREKNGEDFVCMTYDHYARMAQELEESHEDADIRYWNYDFEMSQEKAAALEAAARANEMTEDEFFESCVLYAIQHPEEAKAAIREAEEKPGDEADDIRLVRQYPVYKWETKAQARKRSIAEEKAARADGRSAEPRTETE